MGTQYSVVCHDCKVERELGKFGGAFNPCRTKEEALELSNQIESAEHNWSFSSALLVSFMAEHEGHNCSAFSDHHEDDRIYDYKKEDLW